MSSDARSVASESRVMVALTSVPDRETAETVGQHVVAEGLAACVNVVPGVTSIFRWEGSVQRENEILILFKTTRERIDDLRRRVVELHPYDLPEVVALGVQAGHGPYLDWVVEEVERGA